MEHYLFIGSCVRGEVSGELDEAVAFKLGPRENVAMFGDGSLSFREFVMREPFPLATIHNAVLEFLRGKDDAVLFGAQAVNAYLGLF